MIASKSKYDTLFESSGACNAEIDLNSGKILRVNRRCSELLSISMDHVLGGVTLFEFVQEQDRALIRSHMENVSKGVETEKDIKGHFQSGRKSFRARTAISLLPGEGPPDRLLVSLQELPDNQEDADQELTQANRRLKSMMGSITDGLAYLDRDWIFTYFNDQGARMLDICPENLLGKRVWDVFPHAVGTKFYEGFYEAVEKRQTVFFEEYYPEPLNRWIECRCYPSDEGLSVYFHDITSRKETEIALRQTREQSELQRRVYEAILTNTPDLAYVFDLEHRFIYANEILLKLWGKTLEESVGRNCLELGYEPWHAEMHDREIEQVIATKSAIRGEVPFSGTFGRRIYDYIFVPVLGENGEVEAVAGTTRDVTDRKIAEEMLLEERERLNFALEAAGLGLWEINVEDGSAERSLSHAQIFGYDAIDTEWSYPRFLEHVAVEDRKKVDDSFRMAIQAGANWNIECRIVRSDGAIRWIWNRAQIRRAPNGEVETLLGLICDITASKLAEDEIRRAAETNAKFRTVFEQGTLFAGILTLDGAVIEVNRLALDACGFKRKDVIGKPFWECGWWNRSPELMEIVQAASFAAAKGRVFRCETHYYVADGSERYVDLSIAPVKNDQGEILFVVPTGNDITDRKRLERQIIQQAEELAEQSRRKDEFLAMLGHELRNPLAPIRSALTLLQPMPNIQENSIQTQAREIIERQVNNLTKLVSDLLEVSRVLSGRIRLELQPVDIKQVLHHAVQTVRPLIDRKGHQVEFAFDEAEVFVHADPTRIEEIFVNLINNAAKYTPDHGLIRILCQQNEELTTIRIEDNGEGIDSELIPRIFDLFTQADRSLDRSEGGLGIGLSLARKLVELHGGTIEVQSPPREKSTGSEFIVTLKTLAHAHSPAGGGNTSHQSDLRGLRVLVVDDNEDLVTVLTYALSLRGHEVQIARDGPDGLKTARTWVPDIALLDIGLPGLSGFDVARELRKEFPAMRLLALTGYGRESDIAAAMEAGFDGHLTKPFHLDELERLMCSKPQTHFP